MMLPEKKSYLPATKIPESLSGQLSEHSRIVRQIQGLIDLAQEALERQEVSELDRQSVLHLVQFAQERLSHLGIQLEDMSAKIHFLEKEIPEYRALKKLRRGS